MIAAIPAKVPHQQTRSVLPAAQPNCWELHYRKAHAPQDRLESAEFQLCQTEQIRATLQPFVDKNHSPDHNKGLGFQHEPGAANS